MIYDTIWYIILFLKHYLGKVNVVFSSVHLRRVTTLEKQKFIFILLLYKVQSSSSNLIFLHISKFQSCISFSALTHGEWKLKIRVHNSIKTVKTMSHTPQFNFQLKQTNINKRELKNICRQIIRAYPFLFLFSPFLFTYSCKNLKLKNK